MITMETSDSKYAECISEMIDHCKQTLIEKHGEYATEDNFHNFNQSALLMGISPQLALAGMMSKHTISIYDMMQDRIVDYPIEKWREKIGDHINYLLILWAMVNINGR